MESLDGFLGEGRRYLATHPDGKKHEVTLTNVPAGMKGERILRLSVSSNKLGVEKADVVTVSIPDQNDFSVYDVTYVSEPERYVEVAFTKLLDVAQDMRGLAFIAENTSETVTVDGNKLRLYPDADLWKRA